MSAPDPKAWAMTDDEERAMLDYWRDNAPETGGEFVVESVARRRALEELRTLYASFDDEDRGDDNSADGLIEAALEIRSRIAAIEAEEA